MTKNKKVPVLRFREFEREWNEKLFEKTYSFRSTNSFSRDKLNYEKGEVKNIHYGDIHTKFQTAFDITKEYVPFINEDVNLDKILNENYCKEKDLVIADASEDYADIGKSIELINLNKEKVLAGLHTFLARPDQGNLAKGFGGYLMQSWNLRKQIMVIAQGTKVLGISTKRLAKVKTIIPEEKEQQKIANFLTAIDTKIQQLTKKKALLEAYKKGVMQQIFKQEIRFRDEEGKAFPEWNVLSISSIFSFKQGIQCSVENQFEKKKKGQIRFIRIVDLTSQFEPPRYIDDPGNDNYIGNEDLFMVRYGVPGVIGYGYKGVIANNLFRLIPKNKIDTKFYFYLLSFKRNLILKLVNTSTMPAINFSSLKLLKLQSPCYKEQRVIAKILSSLDKKINQINIHLEHSKQFKKGLLQKMFV